MSGSTDIHVVAIAGPSGSGKTSVARRLADLVPGGGVVFALDAYYRDQRDIPEDQINVDEPDAIESDLLAQHLRALARGHSVHQPVYDYATHARLQDTRIVEPAPHIIVEGLYALHWPDVLALVRTPIFLALDHDTCLRRRTTRDARERGRPPETVRRLYERSVRPMYERHVHPTRVNAMIEIDASLPLDDVVERALAVILRP